MATSNEVMMFIQETLGLKGIALDTQMGKVPGWDSLRHLKLIRSLEKKYAVQIPVDMLGELIKVDQILEYVRQLGVINE